MGGLIAGLVVGGGIGFVTAFLWRFERAVEIFCPDDDEALAFGDVPRVPAWLRGEGGVE